jgi:hypothetical protein
VVNLLSIARDVAFDSRSLHDGDDQANVVAKHTEECYDGIRDGRVVHGTIILLGKDEPKGFGGEIIPVGPEDSNDFDELQQVKWRGVTFYHRG